MAEITAKTPILAPSPIASSVSQAIPLASPLDTATPTENVATEDLHFETVEEWRAAGSPAGTETVSVTVGGSKPEPPSVATEPSLVPESPVAPEPSLEAVPVQSDAEREQELREAVDPSVIAKTEAALAGIGGEVGEDIGAYRQSVEDIRQKLSLAEQVKQAERSWQDSGQEPPPEVVAQLQQAKALVYGNIAPFVDLSRQTIDVRGALRFGVPEQQILAAGVSEDVVKRASAENYIRKQYGGDPLKAIEGGDIEAVRALGIAPNPEIAGIITPQQQEQWGKLSYDEQVGLTLVGMQSRIADRRLQAQSQTQIGKWIIPNTDFDPTKPVSADNPDTVLDIVGVIGAGVDASVLRNAGYNISQDTYNQIKADITRPVETRPAPTTTIPEYTPARSLVEAQLNYTRAETALSQMMDRVASENLNLPREQLSELYKQQPEYFSYIGALGDLQQKGASPEAPTVVPMPPDDAIVYLDKGVQPTGTGLSRGLGLSSSEISSLGRAMRSLNIKPVSGSYVEAYRQLDDNRRRMVAEAFSADLTRGGISSGVAEDVLREALSFGGVPTATFNRGELGKQYDQQKAIATATFLGDLPRLQALYDAGAFGKDPIASAQAYRESLDVIRVQNDIERAVRAGDTNALAKLYEQGAFGNDLAAYADLVKYVEDGGRELSPVNTADVKAVEESFGTEKEYVDAILKAQPKTATLAADVGIAMIPVYGTVYFWDEMGGGMRGLSIAADALTFIPFVGGVSAAAKVAAGVGRGARVVAALKVIPRIAVAEVRAPLTMVVHPLETAKLTARQVRNLGEWALGRSRIPMDAIATVYGTARLDASIAGSEEAAMYIRDELMKMASNGQEPILTFGGKTYTLRQPRFLREGGVVAGGPEMKWVETPGGAPVITKVYPEGYPMAGQRVRESEQGFFVSNTALERFTESSAFGLEKAGAGTIEDNLKALTDAAEQARVAGDTKAASKIDKMVQDYRNAIAAQDINALNKAETKILNKRAEMAIDDTVAEINRLLKDANEKYLIGNIEGAQESMAKAMALEDSLKPAKPGFAVFSPDIEQAEIDRLLRDASEKNLAGDAAGAQELVSKATALQNAKISATLIPSGKSYPGVIFKPKPIEIPSIMLSELKSDMVSSLKLQASNAKRLGQKAKAAELARRAQDIERSTPSGFRKVLTEEMELKFPELAQLPEMKARYYTRSGEGKKLYIFTDKPRSFKDILKAKMMAPIDTVRQIFDPALSVKSVRLTDAERLAEVAKLESKATRLEETAAARLRFVKGNVTDEPYQAALRNARLARLEAEELRKSTSGAKTFKAANKASSTIDEADGYVLAAKRAEDAGDLVSADRLYRAAELIAGRAFTRATATRTGTVMGTMRMAGAAARLSEAGRFDTRMPDLPARLTELRIPDRSLAELARDTALPREIVRNSEARLPEVPRVDRASRVSIEPPRIPVVQKITEPSRGVEGRTPEIPRTPRVLEPPRAPELPRIPRLPEAPRTLRILETPRIPEIPRVPRTPREPVGRETTITKLRGLGVELVGDRAKLPPGSITVKHGLFWRWATPPWNQTKMQTLPKGIAPLGAKNTDKRTVRETVQMIGEPGASVPEKVDADFGIVDFRIYDYGQRIDVEGKGLQTNVGTGVDSTAQGMSVEDGISRPAMTDYYAPKSVSRPAITKTEEPVRGETSVRGINRPKIAEDTKAMLEETYEEPVALAPEPVKSKPKDEFSDILTLSTKDRDDIFGTGERRKKKPANRVNMRKTQPRRGQDNPPTTLRGLRL